MWGIKHRRRSIRVFAHPCGHLGNESLDPYCEKVLKPVLFDQVFLVGKLSDPFIPKLFESLYWSTLGNLNIWILERTSYLLSNCMTLTPRIAIRLVQGTKGCDETYTNNKS